MVIEDAMIRRIIAFDSIIVKIASPLPWSCYGCIRGRSQ